MYVIMTVYLSETLERFLSIVLAYTPLFEITRSFSLEYELTNDFAYGLHSYLITFLTQCRCNAVVILMMKFF